MVAKQQEVVDRLRSLDRSTRLKAVREIKNQIIGNKSKKLSYIKLEAVPRVVELLQENSDAFLLVQSAATVGSFAYGLEDGFRAVVASGGVQHLLHAVSSQDNTVVEAALRALKLVWQVWLMLFWLPNFPALLKQNKRKKITVIPAQRIQEQTVQELPEAYADHVCLAVFRSNATASA